MKHRQTKMLKAEIRRLKAENRKYKKRIERLPVCFNNCPFEQRDTDVEALKQMASRKYQVR